MKLTRLLLSLLVTLVLAMPATAAEREDPPSNGLGAGIGTYMSILAVREGCNYGFPQSVLVWEQAYSALMRDKTAALATLERVWGTTFGQVYPLAEMRGEVQAAIWANYREHLNERQLTWVCLAPEQFLSSFGKLLEPLVFQVQRWERSGEYDRLAREMRRDLAAMSEEQKQALRVSLRTSLVNGVSPGGR